LQWHFPKGGGKTESTLKCTALNQKEAVRRVVNPLCIDCNAISLLRVGKIDGYAMVLKWIGQIDTIVNDKLAACLGGGWGAYVGKKR
jgi:hypothetical protein